MIIVTGAAGFIGSNLVASLNASGRKDIVLVDWLGSDQRWKNLAKHSFEDFIFPEDFGAFLQNASGKVEAVFHLGAISATTATDGDEIIRKNLKPSMDVWRWCTRERVPLFYASSAATYGDGALGFDDTNPIDELQPLNLYGWSKHTFDTWALTQASLGKAPPRWAGFKFFNVYGPNEYHKDDMMSIVAKNFARISAEEKISLFKSHRPDYRDGEQLRDFVYVKDCCNVMLWFLNKATESGIFNVGSGAARSFYDLMQATGAAARKQVQIEFVPMPEKIRDKYQYFTQASMDKIRAAGYDGQFHSLESGVADYVVNYLAKSDPYI
ncbi:ADP-glyceromanno-heptose 6-epimerase [Agrobacterium rhizogenes]|jgi:ADP-L-glycero-D-manno-heptose 6-epimerase|uniref:ADP-glyceromanno-heptose 6-epimerase n=1 Tax=Rhizobium rhizogenes TaxID=359 RepID=UPI001573E091|nr:ADP-glyceromanno-heptose 6-epimerase [Rhizobium rhizogenes]NTF70074.1 ADP-glyceromanno-heptose 6-epimerase [Rhizobium rhizogenes]NTG88262.1 ADP-glyceromanno-heptose 6-epimerase [Rhizobium rhizogenes]